MKKLVLMFSVITINFIGCVPSINYPISGVHKKHIKELNYLTLSILPFEDNRKDKSYLKDTLFNDTMKNDIECYNFESKYKKLNVAAKISKLLTEHIDSLEIFDKVYYNKNDKADIYLSGTIESFAVHSNVNQTYQSTKVAAAPFGIVGALASLTASTILKSNFDFEIKYTKIILKDKNGNILFEIPELYSGDKKEINPLMYCSEIYSLINTELKKHNIKLIDTLIQELPKNIKK